MLQVSIKVELNGLDKAENEVKALLVYINELKKTYAPDLVTPEKKAPTKAVKTPSKPKQAPKVSEPTPEPKKAPKAKTAPKAEPKTEITHKDLIELARGAVAVGTPRPKIKELIASFGVTKIDAIPDDKIADFAEKIKAL